MFSEKQEVGYNLTISMQVDPEVGLAVQMTANAPKGATADELAEALAVMRRAGWLERIAANERLSYRNHYLKQLREEKVAAAKAEGQALDDEHVAEEDAAVNAAILKIDAELAADRAAYQGNGAAE